ncbi:hypothetical protein Ddye_000919 [Dipteronia dyeriana]|uniref:Uncharacterized protein n=1 Tax=Dipteronia dyeriana TaxID=168575 RepID=A0AAD9XN88_9ROSI|nr:hypothetical protein Ddye_000919 [Dipteronia dyeriana]
MASGKGQPEAMKLVFGSETGNNGNSSYRHFGFHDTTENENVYVHEVSEPQFDPISNQVPIWSDDQFTHIQRLVPPPSASYSINFGEVAPRPVDMCIAVGELFESKQQLQSQLGRYAFTNRFQIRLMKLDPTRYQVWCIVRNANGDCVQLRPAIAIEATFFKGPYAEVLFVAVCMDGNDQIFPLAFGVGDSETNEA